MDGSCSKTDTGRTQTGYAIVQLLDTITEAKQLPTFHSAQAAELIALTHACNFAENQNVTTVFTQTTSMPSQHCFTLLSRRKTGAC